MLRLSLDRQGFGRPYKRWANENELGQQAPNPANDCCRALLAKYPYDGLRTQPVPELARSVYSY